MKAHLLVFDNLQVNRQEIQSLVNGIETIVNWCAFFGNALCLASDETADQLAKRIRKVFPNLEFLISTVDTTESGGWMPKFVWSFIAEPQPVSLEMADA